MNDGDRDFKDLVRSLYERHKHVKRPEDEFLTAAKIAGWVKQKTGRALMNTSIVSSVTRQYSHYFDVKWNNQYARKYAVKWELIRENFPELLPSGIKASPTSGLTVSRSEATHSDRPPDTTGFVGGRDANARSQLSLRQFCLAAIDALTDEYEQAKVESESKPITVIRYRSVDESSDTDAARVYEATVQNQLCEAPAIPEGVPVRVRWWFTGDEKIARLLQWDLLNDKAYVAFDEALNDQQMSSASRITLTTHELIRPLQEDLERLSIHSDSLGWRVLSDGRQKRLGTEIRQSICESSDEADLSQEEAISNALHHDCAFIWGPPGTGKTHTIGRLICELLANGKRVLATAISNVAVDNMAIKFVNIMKLDYKQLEKDFNSGLFLRFGYTKNDELGKDEYQPLFSVQREMRALLDKMRELKNQRIKLSQQSPAKRAIIEDELKKLESKRIDITRRAVTDGKVVFTTATQVYTNAVFSNMEEYDVVVVDEASMMAVPTFCVIGSRAKRQIVIAGDFRQLAPIAISRSDMSTLYLQRSPFEWLNLTERLEHPSIRMLQFQRRMDPSISDWISRQFYRRLLKDAPSRNRPVNLPSELPRRLVLWDISRSRHKGPAYYTFLSDSKSRYNLGSEDCVCRLAITLSGANPDASIAVIVTYREQAQHIKGTIDANLSGQSVSIQVGTVHTFQGSEADIVIWDMVDTVDQGLGLPYVDEHGDRLTNVAVSRARQLMIVACDRRLKDKGSEQSRSGRSIMDLLRNVDSCEDILDVWIDETTLVPRRPRDTSTGWSLFDEGHTNDRDKLPPSNNGHDHNAF